MHTQINDERTQWYRHYWREKGIDQDIARIVVNAIRQGYPCVCCRPGYGETDVCPNGHRLCHDCARDHGCIACALLG